MAQQIVQSAITLLRLVNVIVQRVIVEGLLRDFVILLNVMAQLYLEGNVIRFAVVYQASLMVN